MSRLVYPAIVFFVLLFSAFAGLVVSVYCSFYYDNQTPLDLLSKPMPPTAVLGIVALAVVVSGGVALVESYLIFRLFQKYAPRKFLNHGVFLVNFIIVMSGCLVQSYTFLAQRIA